MQFILNDQCITTESPPGRIALDFLRRELRLTGTREGCREGDCGACTVLLGDRDEDGTVRYRPVCACILPLGDVAGRHLVTIEGLGGRELTPVQQAIVNEGASQCGFCTPGIVMALTGYLLSAASLSEAEAGNAVAGNICRCTGYGSILRAVRAVISGLDAGDTGPLRRRDSLIGQGVIPDWFRDIPDRLQAMAAGRSAPGGDPAATLVAGGTDLFVQRPEELATRPLHFLLQDRDMTRIRVDDTWVTVGAGVVTEEFRRNSRLTDSLPAMKPFVELIASRPIRERATVGGNIVNASPIGDLTIMLLALDAEVGLCAGETTRMVPLCEFYRGYKQTVLNEGERIEWIRIPRAAGRRRFNFEKVARRPMLDIATVNSALSLDVADGVIRSAALAVGGVSPVPLYLVQASARLTGRPLTPGTVNDAVTAALGEIAPIDDVRGSKAYKTLLVRQLIRAHFLTLFPDGDFEEGLS